MISRVSERFTFGIARAQLPHRARGTVPSSNVRYGRPDSGFDYWILILLVLLSTVSNTDVRRSALDSFVIVALKEFSYPSSQYVKLSIAQINFVIYLSSLPRNTDQR